MNMTSKIVSKICSVLGVIAVILVIPGGIVITVAYLLALWANKREVARGKS
jgi:hypothetical protein